MRGRSALPFAVLAFAVASTGGCTKAKVGALTSAGDGGALARAEAPAAGDGGRGAAAPQEREGPDALEARRTDGGGARSAAAPLPTADAQLAVVAIGKSFNSRILWAKSLGDRFWLSAQGMDAIAVGAGPLARGPDPLARLPYKAGADRVEVFGAWPNLFAHRAKNVNTRMEAPESKLFVGRGVESGDVTWSPPKALEPLDFPIACLAHRDGVGLVVHTSIAFNAMPFLPDDQAGAKLLAAKPDGTVSTATLGLPRTFLPWSVSSDAGWLAFLGTVQITRKPSDDQTPTAPSGVHVARVSPKGDVKLTKIQGTTDATMWMSMYGSGVVQRGARTVVIPAFEMAEVALWKGGSLAVGMFDESGAYAQRNVPGGIDCRIRSADVEGDVLWVVRSCPEPEATALVRVGPGGRSEVISIPRIVKVAGSGFREATRDARSDVHACIPQQVTVQGDDLWVVAHCGTSGDGQSGPSVPVLLRRGRKQEPLVLP